MQAATVAETWTGVTVVARVRNYKPLDVVRVGELPCDLLLEAAADLRDGAPHLRTRWMGVTMTGERADLPYGRVPEAGTFWYVRLGLQPRWRGCEKLTDNELQAATDFVWTWLSLRCPDVVWWPNGEVPGVNDEQSSEVA